MKTKKQKYWYKTGSGVWLGDIYGKGWMADAGYDKCLENKRIEFTTRNRKLMLDLIIDMPLRLTDSEMNRIINSKKYRVRRTKAYT